MRMPYEEALALVALASAGGPERAALLEKARATFTRLGAEHDLRRL